ncbi:hypothetical protein BJ875DRAFT_497950 [Amylocarpus encephaloides]|uniref:Uncharacterized protein n=1 Tax=Amylocarpus encephaloides TaxID=45428 RepID=A0A9P7YDW6_9HELO|nr:hypothetical protein BJ875DRAFT_497950 [Amylocarpus encephaloides]
MDLNWGPEEPSQRFARSDSGTIGLRRVRTSPHTARLNAIMEVQPYAIGFNPLSSGSINVGDFPTISKRSGARYSSQSALAQIMARDDELPPRLSPSPLSQVDNNDRLSPAGEDTGRDWHLLLQERQELKELPKDFKLNPDFSIIDKEPMLTVTKLTTVMSVWLILKQMIQNIIHSCVPELLVLKRLLGLCQFDTCDSFKSQSTSKSTSDHMILTIHLPKKLPANSVMDPFVIDIPTGDPVEDEETTRQGICMAVHTHNFKEERIIMHPFLDSMKTKQPYNAKSCAAPGDFFAMLQSDAQAHGVDFSMDGIHDNVGTEANPIDLNVSNENLKGGMGRHGRKETIAALKKTTEEAKAKEAATVKEKGVLKSALLMHRFAEY